MRIIGFTTILTVIAFTALLGFAALVALFDLANNLPGDVTDAHPRIHETRMQAGGLDVSAE